MRVIFLKFLLMIILFIYWMDLMRLVHSRRVAIIKECSILEKFLFVL